MRKGRNKEAEASIVKLLGPLRSHYINNIKREVEISIQNQSQHTLSDQV